MSTPRKERKSLSAFDDPDEKPSDGALRRCLGAAAPLWSQLVAHVDETYPSVTQQWNFGGAKYGWSLRLKRGERVILYLIPQPKHFLAGIVLGATTVAAAQNGDVKAPVERRPPAAPSRIFGEPVRAARGRLSTRMPGVTASGCRCRIPRHSPQL